AHQHQVDRAEVELRDVLATDDLIAEVDLVADGFARRDRVNLFHGEVQFLEDVQHFAAHIARGADDGHPVTHRTSPRLEGASRYAPKPAEARRAILAGPPAELKWGRRGAGATG